MGNCNISNNKKSTVCNSSDNNAVNDYNYYESVLNKYNHLNGFGSFRNDALKMINAIVLISDRNMYNNLSNLPENLTDRQIYMILTTKSTFEALLLLRTLLSSTDMCEHPLYEYTIKSFHPIYGFCDYKAIAINIVDSFMMNNNISKYAENFSDFKLFEILLSRSKKEAIEIINSYEVLSIE